MSVRVPSGITNYGVFCLHSVDVVRARNGSPALLGLFLDNRWSFQGISLAPCITHRDRPTRDLIQLGNGLRLNGGFVLQLRARRGAPCEHSGTTQSAPNQLPPGLQFRPKT